MVAALRDYAVCGITNIANYIQEHPYAFRKMVTQVERIFKNITLGLTEFGKFLKDGVKQLIMEGIKIIVDIGKKTIVFLKKNAGEIVCYTGSGVTVGLVSAARTLITFGIRSAVVGTIIEHCVCGGLIGLGTGLLVAGGKEMYCYIRDRQRNQNIEKLMLPPEVDAEQAERRGLEEIQLKVQELINLLNTIAKQEEQRPGREAFALKFSISRGNLLEMQRDIPKVCVIKEDNLKVD